MTQTLWGKSKHNFDLEAYKLRLKQQCDLQFGPNFDWTDKKNITHDVNVIIHKLKDDIRAFAKHSNVPIKTTAIFYGRICVYYLSTVIKKRHDAAMRELNKRDTWGSNTGKEER